jgi:hypothetical protein
MITVGVHEGNVILNVSSQHMLQPVVMLVSPEQAVELSFLLQSAADIAVEADEDDAEEAGRTVQ